MKPRKLLPNRCCILKLEEIPTTHGIFLSSGEQLLDETVVPVDLWLNIPCDFVDPAVGMPVSAVQSELLTWLSDSCCRQPFASGSIPLPASATAYLSLFCRFRQRLASVPIPFSASAAAHLSLFGRFRRSLPTCSPPAYALFRRLPPSP